MPSAFHPVVSVFHSCGIHVVHRLPECGCVWIPRGASGGSQSHTSMVTPNQPAPHLDWHNPVSGFRSCSWSPGLPLCVPACHAVHGEVPGEERGGAGHFLPVPNCVLQLQTPHQVSDYQQTAHLTVSLSLKGTIPMLRTLTKESVCIQSFSSLSWDQ